jgi:hypothetical protein
MQPPPQGPYPPPGGPYGPPGGGYGPPPGGPPQPPKSSVVPSNRTAFLAVAGLLLLSLFTCGICSLGQKKPATGTVDTSAAPTAAAPASREKGWHNPATACRLIASEGLAGGDYKEMGGEWTCVSKGMDLSTPNAAGLPNTLRYFAEGTESRVNLLKLYANVNVPAQATAIQAKMSASAGTLMRNATGAELPPEASAALLYGRPGKWQIAGVKAVLEKDVWPTGKGFSLKFTIE